MKPIVLGITISSSRIVRSEVFSLSQCLDLKKTDMLSSSLRIHDFVNISQIFHGYNPCYP